MIRPALLLCCVVVFSSACTLFSRSVPCNDASDCPTPFDACVAGRCVEDDDTGPDVRAGRCGDGIVDEGEACDDGNDDNTDACAACREAACGDDFVQTGEEECDDGNAADDDGCINCREAFCGDGFIRNGVEVCDDGNAVGEDACTTTCNPARCGDGFVRDGVELCDDGNEGDGDDCPTSCEPARCGDGFIRIGEEECDDGNTIDDLTCTAGCLLPVATVAARATFDGCSGTAMIGGVPFRFDNDATAQANLGEPITFIADPGCTSSTLSGCVEDAGTTCTVDTLTVEVSFVGLAPSATAYGGSDAVRLRDAALLGDSVVAVGDRDGTVLGLGRDITTAQGFAVDTIAGTTTIRAQLDAVGDGSTSLDAVLASGDVAVVIGTQSATHGLGACAVSQRGASVFFIENSACTGAVSLAIATGTLVVKGVAGTPDDFWILADFVVNGSGTIDSVTVAAGAVLIHLEQRALSDILGVTGVEPVAIATVGDRLAIAGRVRDALPCLLSTTPAVGDGVVGLFATNGQCASAVAMRGSAVTVAALAATATRVLVGGAWSGSLLVDGDSPIDSTLVDGFVADLTVDGNGTFTTTVVRPVQGDGDDRVLGLFIDADGFGLLTSSNAPARFAGRDLVSGTSVTTATSDPVLVRRTVSINVGTGGRAFALRRGTGSAIAVVGERTGAAGSLEGVVHLLGAP